MSLEHRIKEEPDLGADEADGNGRELFEHEVMVHIKEEPPRSDSEGSEGTPTTPQEHAVEERVVGTGTLQQPGTAGATQAEPNVAKVRVKRELIDQERLTQEISPCVCQIKVERIDTVGEGCNDLERSVVEQVKQDTSPRVEQVVTNTSPGVKPLVDPTEGSRRRKLARTQSEVRDDSAAKSSTGRQKKPKENGETLIRSLKKRQPGPHLCDVCNKEFKKANKLLIHKRTHTGERPYTCNICQKQFSYSNGLKVHLRTHTGEKPHVCQTCNKNFGQWSSLKAHERIHTGEKPYSCDICKKEFAQLNNLNKHQLVHTEIKQYSCEICKKEFKDNNSLKRHEPIHIDEKHFPCGKCKKHFATARHLRDHERAHTRKRKRHSSGTS
ncbi:zinc finger protein 184-like [Cydia pomonella]|uniref:zinc finger protein 184-like n=1 Tax=Cydia pomonella TaxID=82600 RepID=UPI002ADDB8E8|nr:zinc finger protein 184-like [Cydia pomonella]